MNWDDPTARLALIERVGVDEYNRQMRDHIAQRGAIYTVSTRFGLLYAVKDTKQAFSTREQAEAYLKGVGA